MRVVGSYLVLCSFHAAVKGFVVLIGASNCVDFSRLRVIVTCVAKKSLCVVNGA